MLHVNRDSHALTTLPCPTDFPAVIQNALGRIAGRVGELAHLAARSRLLLAEFVRCLDVRSPAEPIRIRNGSLASALGLSERTIGSIKAQLVASGWIQRNQVKSRRRGMQIADVWLTPMALTALGLGGQNPNCGQLKSRPLSKRRQVDADAFWLPQFSSKRHLAAPVGFESKDPPPLSPSELEHLRMLQRAYGEDLALMPDGERGGQGYTDPTTDPNPSSTASKVPDDLRLLTEKGLSDAAVFKLMGIATRARCRLGDIVKVTAHAIRNHAKSVFSYVLKLIHSPKDWTRLASALPAEGRQEPTPPPATTSPWGVEIKLTEAKAITLANGLHERVGDRCIIDPDQHVVWSLEEGRLAEAPFAVLWKRSSTTEQDGAPWVPTPWDAVASPSETESQTRARLYDRYERLAARLHRALDDGAVKLVSRQEALEFVHDRCTRADRFRTALQERGAVGLDRENGVAYQYIAGQLFQASLEPHRTTRRNALEWRLQMGDRAVITAANRWSTGALVVRTGATSEFEHSELFLSPCHTPSRPR